jgi:hypothetical protein
MLLSRRISIKGFALSVAAVTVLACSFVQAEEQAAGISDTQLEQLIKDQGLTPVKVEQRFDFGFKATLDKDEWELSMSAVLSQDGQTVWVMAWLDELPESPNDVPIVALLRLLSTNDKMGNGKFFAYISANRRFVLQQVIPTKDLTTEHFREVLKDLGATVVETAPQWTVANWKAGAPATRSAVNDSKYDSPARR